MGIINPVGKLHPGTGRKKRYARTALLEALLLQTLLDMTGRPAADLASLVKGILVIMEHGGEFSTNVGDFRYTCKFNSQDLRLRISIGQYGHGYVINFKPFFEHRGLNVEDFPEMTRLLKNPKF